MRPIRSVSAALAAAVLALAAATAYALDAGERAPALELPDLSGEQIRLSDLRGKVVLVDFWATWCDPCLEEMPVLQALYDRHRERGFVVLAVSVDDDVSNVRRFAERRSLTFPVVHDREKRVVSRWAPPNMPTSFVVDRQGVVRHVNRGFRSGDGERIERQVVGLLGAGP